MTSSPRARPPLEHVADWPARAPIRPGHVDLRVQGQQRDREVAVWLLDEEVAAHRGEIANRGRGDRLHHRPEHREALVAAELRQRRRGADDGAAVVHLDARETGAAQAHQPRHTGRARRDARHDLRAAGDHDIVLSEHGHDLGHGFRYLDG